MYLHDNKLMVHIPNRFKTCILIILKYTDYMVNIRVIILKKIRNIRIESVDF